MKEERRRSLNEREKEEAILSDTAGSLWEEKAKTLEKILIRISRLFLIGRTM